MKLILSLVLGISSLQSYAFESEIPQDFCSEERKMENDRSKLRSLMNCFNKPFNEFMDYKNINAAINEYRDGLISFEEFDIKLKSFLKLRSDIDTLKKTGYAILATVLEQKDLFESYSNVSRYDVLVKYATAMQPVFDLKWYNRDYQMLSLNYPNERNMKDNVFKAASDKLGELYEIYELDKETKGNHFPGGLFAFMVDENTDIEEPLSYTETPHRLHKYLKNFDKTEDIKFILKQYHELKEAHFQIPEYIAAPDAVRVSVVDSGFNYLLFPEIMYFNSNSPMYDMIDDDTEVYLTDRYDKATHGVGTSGSLLSLVAHVEPEVINNNMIDLGLIKIFPDISSNVDPKRRNDNDLNVIKALMGKVDIVSRSISTYYISEEFDKALSEIDFLYVIAAGNSGRQIYNDPMKERKESLSSCYTTTEEKYRPKDRILCVGALEKGIIQDAITDYTNVGSHVDVYTYESFLNLCPNGTSCATPGIAAAATMVKAKYPELSPEQLRLAIVNASTPTEVNITKHPLLADLDTDTALVPFFDPERDMEKAYIEAEKLLNLR